MMKKGVPITAPIHAMDELQLRKHIKSMFEKLAAIIAIQYTAVPSFDHQNFIYIYIDDMD